MVSGTDTGSASGNAKVAVSRWLFHRNASRVHRAIVQSNIIAGDLRENFPELGDRIRIIPQPAPQWLVDRSEEHTSELQSLMRISYAVFCLKKKTTINNTTKMKYISNT